MYFNNRHVYEIGHRSFVRNELARNFRRSRQLFSAEGVDCVSAACSGRLPRPRTVKRHGIIHSGSRSLEWDPYSPESSVSMTFVCNSYANTADKFVSRMPLIR